MNNNQHAFRFPLEHSATLYGTSPRCNTPAPLLAPKQQQVQAFVACFTPYNTYFFEPLFAMVFLTAGFFALSWPRWRPRWPTGLFDPGVHFLHSSPDRIHTLD